MVVDTRWAVAILRAIPGSLLVLTFIADWLGLVTIERTWLAGLIFLVGTMPLLWVTRLIEWRAVYLGLGQLVVGTLDLASCGVGWANQGVLAGWLAVAAAVLALALWGVGVSSRRFKLSAFYTEPCFHTAFALTVGAFVAALNARYLGRESYVLAAAALGLNVVVTMLLARTWRAAELTYAAVFHFVAATYLVLFSVGKNDPAMAYVLGLVAMIEAIVLWAIGFGCRRARDSWTAACARPLYHWTVGLTCAARSALRSVIGGARPGGVFVPLDRQEPAACGMALRHGRRSARRPCYFRWLGQLPRIELVGWGRSRHSCSPGWVS